MQNNFDEMQLLDINSDDWLIEEGVLVNCYLSDAEKIKIPSGVIEIGEYSFTDASNLRSLYVPKSVKVIREQAFAGCGKLQQLFIENTDIILQNAALADCDSLDCVYIGGENFKVIVTDGEYGIGDDRGNCIEKYMGKDSAYRIDGDIKRIGEKAFYNRDTLQEVTVPESVVEIDDMAFAECKGLTNVELTESLEIIDRRVFENCTGILQIKIPKSVYSILDRAFGGWNSNQTIYIPQKFKKVKFLQKWRRGCKANIVYY